MRRRTPINLPLFCLLNLLLGCASASNEPKPIYEKDLMAEQDDDEESNQVFVEPPFSRH